jgi:hypothetical protein
MLAVKLFDAPLVQVGEGRIVQGAGPAGWTGRSGRCLRPYFEPSVERFLYPLRPCDHHDETLPADILNPVEFCLMCGPTSSA